MAKNICVGKKERKSFLHTHFTRHVVQLIPLESGRKRQIKYIKEQLKRIEDPKNVKQNLK